MPLVKRKVAKQRPVEELQRIAEWLYGDITDPVVAREAKADLHFIEAEILRQLWGEVREQILPRWRKDPEKFSEQIDRLSSLCVLRVSEVAEFCGKEEAEIYAAYSFRNLPA